MAYTVELLEKGRRIGFRQENLFGMMLKEFSGVSDNENLKILDLGCGTGFFTRILKKQFKNAEIIGMDINEELLEGAKKITKEENLNIKYEIGDITNISYEAETFDIVMCDIMLECFEDIQVPLKEMKRVCKTGGVVLCMEPFYQSGFEYHEDVEKDIRDLLIKNMRVGRSFGTGPSLPEKFNKVGLNDIDLISWFWGTIGNRKLSLMSKELILKDMKREIDQIEQAIYDEVGLKEFYYGFSDEEKFKLINHFKTRYETFKLNPDKLEKDMSVRGLPVFLTRGVK